MYISEGFIHVECTVADLDKWEKMNTRVAQRSR
jgi:hypothetical protein